MPETNKEVPFYDGHAPNKHVPDMHTPQGHANVPEEISVQADDVLLDEILREFGDAQKSNKPNSTGLDEEVAKIIASVKSSLAAENNPEEAFGHEAKIPQSQILQSPAPEPELSAAEKNSLDMPMHTLVESDHPRTAVKVISEDDSSPIFGDNFAKYFGPEAGLATQLDLPVTDFDDSDGKAVRRRFGKWFTRRNKHSVEPEESEDTDETDDIEYTDAEEEAEQTEQTDQPELETVKPRRTKRRAPIEYIPETASEEELPEEIEDVSPEDAAKALVEEMGMIRLKLLVGSAFCVLLLYLTLAPKLGLFIPGFLTYVRNPYLYLFLTSAFLVLIMIMCIDTVATGVRDLLFLKPNMESVVTLSCLVSILHAISILVFPQWEGYYPYSAVSAASLLFSTYYRHKRNVARLRSYKTLSAMSRPNLVVCEKEINGGADAVVKYKAAQPRFFVHQMEQRDLVAKMWAYAAPMLIILAIVCAAVASFGTGQPQRFLWNFSAMLAAAAPLSLCLPFNLPFAKATKHLSVMGEAIAGWEAADELSDADSIIVTDTDLFPPGSISLNGLKIFGGYAVDKVISYSASLIAASGAGTARPFMDLLHDQSASLRKVTNFRHYENGGIGGDINGESIVAGSQTFMLRTGIRIPKDVPIKHAIYIAINQELAGIFAVNYNTTGTVKKAFRILQKNGITPVLAIRDFNITPAMIESKFNISTDVADYPPIEDRLALSNPDRIYIAKPSAVVGREGLGPYAECVVCARNLKRTVKICLGLTLASIVIGMLLMFYLMYTHAPVQATPPNLLAYMALWLVPNLIAANWVKL